MAAKLKWSPRARADLLKLYMDIAAEQPTAAERYYTRIEDKARLLLTQPRMGARRWDIRPSLRMLVEVPFVMFYRIMPDTDDVLVESVEIIRVVNGRQDLRSLF